MIGTTDECIPVMPEKGCDLSKTYITLNEALRTRHLKKKNADAIILLFGTQSA
jgi:hypothetical protein